ncbi:MAG: Uma2 family endonuclease [Microcystis sp. LE19-114.1B]|nr:Uma2 family endonuclease [Microcystis sp. LE19-114.1B]
MTIAQSLPLVESHVNPEIIFPEGEFWSDEPPLESNLHLQQIILLIQCLEWWWREREDYFAAGNLTIYYSPNQKKSEFFRGPDFFVVLGTNPNPNRRSWVIWREEGKYPNLIVEILSDSTAKVDREEKKQIYQDIFRTPDYFWFDPESLEFEGFTLISGQYQPITPNAQGRLWSQQLGLYLGLSANKLRYFTPEGELVPTPAEAAQQAENRAVEAENRVLEAENQVEQEKQKAAKLAAKLRELGIDAEENL